STQKLFYILLAKTKVHISVTKLHAHAVYDDHLTGSRDERDVQPPVLPAPEVLNQLPQREPVRERQPPHAPAAAVAAAVRQVLEGPRELGVLRPHPRLLAFGHVDEHVELGVLAGVDGDVHHQHLRRRLAAAAAGPGLLRPLHRHVLLPALLQSHGEGEGGRDAWAGGSVYAGRRLGPLVLPLQRLPLLVRVPEPAGVEDVADADAHGPALLVVEDEAGVAPVVAGAGAGTEEVLVAERGGPEVPHAVDVGVVRVEDGVAPRRAEHPHVPAHPDVHGGVRGVLERAGGAGRAAGTELVPVELQGRVDGHLAVDDGEVVLLHAGVVGAERKIVLRAWALVEVHDGGDVRRVAVGVVERRGRVVEYRR
uniref:Uncharacterized protein n=1 Tax=Triticum urartu TaxID=4572 RepID=A0A8R7UP50_TRIUA